MTFRILSVAYPFAPVRPDTAGGAEQILLTLDAALAARGHTSVVVAQEGSEVAGTLIAVPRCDGNLDEESRQAVRETVRNVIEETLARVAIDLVHMHGIDFASCLPSPGVPVLATLHLPLDWYAPDALRPARPLTFLHGVSAAQMAHHSLPHLLPPIENGVPLPFADPIGKKDFALVLTRICPEKGVHLAIEAARAAAMPLVIAGQVFAYPDHQRYFEREIEPRLDAMRRFIGPVGGAEKARLLAQARCVLVPSTVPETSSLVAREALAAGTPVIAFARGALLQTIEHGRTGFLVNDVAAMANAMRLASTLDPDLCRRVARERFAESAMVERYLDVYRALTELRPGAQAACARP